jgi:hypothetical protein
MANSNWPSCDHLGTPADVTDACEPGPPLELLIHMQYWDIRAVSAWLYPAVPRLDRNRVRLGLFGASSSNLQTAYY